MNKTNIPVQVELELESNTHEYTLGVEENIGLSGGTNDYEKLKNKPSINGVELVKNKSFTATPLPSFNVMEVKKSEKLLTVAKSPKLDTKARSLQRQRQNEAEEIKRILSFKLEQ